MTSDFVESVLRDHDNDLGAIAAEFEASGEGCLHINRHVFEPWRSEAQASPTIESACAAAIELASKWRQQRTMIQTPCLFVSNPYAIICEEWMDGVANAPPPHVYVCLGRSSGSFRPVQHEDLLLSAKSGYPVLDALLGVEHQLSRLESMDGETASWVVEVRE